MLSPLVFPYITQVTDLVVDALKPQKEVEGTTDHCWNDDVAVFFPAEVRARRWEPIEENCSLEIASEH